LGLIDGNPLTGISIQVNIKDKEHLTFDELAKLHEIYLNKELLNEPYGKNKQERLQQFLIATYTALRYSDAKQLRKSKHLKNGKIIIGILNVSKYQYRILLLVFCSRKIIFSACLAINHLTSC